MRRAPPESLSSFRNSRWFPISPSNKTSGSCARSSRRSAPCAPRRCATGQGSCSPYQFPDIDPSTEVRYLSLADRQIVEIAKALAGAPDVLILDEATSALAPRETEWLLRLVQRLAADGKLVIYISHRFAEIRNVANRITVFRNGATVATHDIAAVTDDDVIGEMLGRRMDRLYPERRPAATERIALKVRNLVSGDRLGPIDLDLHEGEVLGVAGIQGHGQRELFHALFGVGHVKGEIERWGEAGIVRGPRQALAGRNGVALVPEDRREQGLLLSKSIRENLSLAVASGSPGSACSTPGGSVRRSLR